MEASEVGTANEVSPLTPEPPTASSAPHRIGAAAVCLRISAVIYVLVGLLFFPLMTAGFDDMSAFPLLAAFGMFAFCVVLAILLGRLIEGLWDRKLWAWAAGLAVFGIYIPSGFFLLGAIGVWALLQPSTRAEFGQS